MPADPMAAFRAAFSSPQHQPFSLPGDQPDSPAALLIHGFPGTPAEMRPLGQVFNRLGWAVEGLLLPGFGPDIETLEARRYEDWRAAIDRKFADLHRTHPTIVIAGHSMGGALALDVASRLKPDGVVAFAPFWRLNNVLWPLLPAIKRVIPRFSPFRLIKLDFNDPETRAGMAQFLPGADLNDPAVQQGVRGFTIPTNLFDQIRRAGVAANHAVPTLTMPVLILQGESDTLVRPAETEALAQRIPGLQRYQLVPGEHNIILPASPGWRGVEAAVRDFAMKLKGESGK
jgi:carboxylesterase